MKVHVDIMSVIPSAEMEGDDADDTRLLREMLDEATNLVESFHWCDGIIASYFGLGVGGVVAVFLYRIEHKRRDVDDWVWVVVGDLPPAYITCEDAPNPACALDGYIGAMREWADAVKSSKSVDDLIPVNAPCDEEHANMLMSRLDFLEENILCNYKDDL